VAAAVLFWVYAPTLAVLAHRWGQSANYSHGYLVPLFALFLLWSRRASLAGSAAARPSWWCGAFLCSGLALKAGGTFLYLNWLDDLSLLPCLAGLTLLLGGWPALRWSWPAISFLAFMLPLPYRLEVALTAPLQRVGTWASTYALQALGFAAFAEGNVIRLGSARIGVVEACSGLSMLVVFFTLSTAVAILVRRPLWERLVIVASALPIALLANVARIAATGALHELASPQLADLVFHDLAGWLMMPLALVLLWIELRLLSWVVLTREVDEPGELGVCLFGPTT
jgi:exosortase